MSLTQSMPEGKAYLAGLGPNAKTKERTAMYSWQGSESGVQQQQHIEVRHKQTNFWTKGTQKLK